MRFDTGVTRSANTILAEQTAKIKATHDQLDLRATSRAGRPTVALRGCRRGWRRDAQGLAGERQLAQGSPMSGDLAVDARSRPWADGAKLTGRGRRRLPARRSVPVERQACRARELAAMNELLVAWIASVANRSNVERDIWG